MDFDKYSGFCIKQYSSINWNPASPETLTVDEPCRGLILLVNGDVHIGESATISMAKKGSILPCNPDELLDIFGISKKIQHIVNMLKTLKGGIGGNGGHGANYGASASVGGIGGEGRICQGGFGAGPGGVVHSSGRVAGNGGDVIYPEGRPQNGASNDSLLPNTGTDGFNGGTGGNCAPLFELYYADPGISYGAAAGGGSIGSSATTGGKGEHTGGFILIIARGIVIIEGTLDVTGGDGGSGGEGAFSGGGGGGAGGGVIAVFAGSTINTTSATKILTGGAGGVATGVNGSTSGTAGQNGTYYEEQL